MLNYFSPHVLYGFHFFNKDAEADTILFETSGFHESNNWYELSILLLALVWDLWYLIMSKADVNDVYVDRGARSVRRRTLSELAISRALESVRLCSVSVCQSVLLVACFIHLLLHQIIVSAFPFCVV